MLSKKKIVSSLSGNFIETLVGFVIIFFVTRVYSQEEVGIYFIVIAIAAILNNLKEGFLQNGFVKYLVESAYDRKVEKAGFFLSMAGDVIKVFVFQFIAFLYAPVQPFVIPFIMYTLGYGSYRWLLFVHKSSLDMQSILKGNLIVFASTLIGIGLIYYCGYPASVIFLANGVAYTLPIPLLSLNRRLILRNLSGNVSFPLVGKMSRFGKYGFLKEVSGSLAHQAGIFISAYFLSLEATSILGLASRYTILIAIPGASLGGMLYPLLLKHVDDIERLRWAAYDGIGKTYAILFPIAFAIVLSAPLVIYVLHGTAYLLAALLLAIKVLTSAFLIPIGSGYSSMMNTMDQPRAITYLVVISSVTNILLSIFLIKFLGLWGAVIAPVLTEVVGFGIMKKKLKQALDFRMIEVVLATKNYWYYWFKTFTRTPWKKLKFQS